MKTIPHTLIGIMALVISAQSNLFAGGSEIEVLLKSGIRYTGELLAERDSAVVLSMLKDADDKMLSRNPSVVSIIRIDSIAKVMEEGHSHLLVEMGLGLASGVVVGAILGLSGSKSKDPIANVFTQSIGGAAGAGIGGLVGLGAGAIVGAATSSSDQVYQVTTPSGRAALRLSARYPMAEPSFLELVK